MEKWLEDAQEAQANLAVKFAESRVALITQDIVGPNIDLEAYKLTIREELEHTAHEAIVGYSDWLANKIVLSNNFEVQPLPKCEPEDLDAIAKNYDVPSGFLRDFLTFFHEIIGENLPLVGKITQDGMLTPNKENLKKLADLYGYTVTP